MYKKENWRCIRRSQHTQSSLSYIFFFCRKWKALSVLMASDTFTVTPALGHSSRTCLEKCWIHDGGGTWRCINVISIFIVYCENRVLNSPGRYLPSLLVYYASGVCNALRRCFNAVCPSVFAVHTTATQSQIRYEHTKYTRGHSKRR